MTDVLDVVLSIVIGTGGTIALIAWDERRLSAEVLDRAWPTSTRLAASFAFGPLALPVHFFRTRRSVLGTGLGLLAAACLLGVTVLASYLVHLID